MDLATAANSAETPSEATRRALQDSTFSGGFYKLWDQGTQYVADVVFAFDHPVDANRFLQFEVDYLHRSPTASTYSDPTIPGATGFLLNGVTHTHPSVFCQGIWFAVNAEVFNLYHCDPLMPTGTTLVEVVARAQYLRLAQAPHSPSAG
jgi:hypothetical protein